LNVSAREVGRKPRKERKRQSVHAMTHSINHVIRVEALAIFHEGEFSAGEVAKMIGEDVKTVTGHIHELYESGCIEFAGHKEVDGMMRPVYRAIVLPEVTPKVYRSMSLEDRHELNGAVTQAILTEAVSSYGAGKMDEDEDLYLVWNAPYLDARGEREMHDFLATCFKEGAKKIHARSANRMAKSGETGHTKVVGFLSFRRGRPGRPDGGYFNSEFDER
jgi:DNA-binding transcriptional ArsR family regulator